MVCGRAIARWSAGVFGGDVFAGCGDARVGRDAVRDDGGEEYAQPASERDVALEQGVTVIDGDERATDDDCDATRSAYNAAVGRQL